MILFFPRRHQNHRYKKTHSLIGIIIFLLINNCATILSIGEVNPERCVQAAIERIESLPQKNYLLTLDGQNILLEEFFNECLRYQPYCTIYKKYYYWKSEVKEIISNSSIGFLTHKVRMYQSPMSECYSEDTDPGKTHGDVAEFYDEKGVFMGLAVYTGEGKYYVINYSGYKRDLRLTI